MVRKAYYLYFGCKVGDQDKSWAPHICCSTSATTLRQWLNKKKKWMPFAVPMVWRNPTDHISDCYFCMTPPVSKGLTRKNKHVNQFPNIPSAILPDLIEKYFLFLRHLKNTLLIRINKKLKVLQVVVNSQCHRRNRILHRVFPMKHILYPKMN